MDDDPEAEQTPHPTGTARCPLHEEPPLSTPSVMAEAVRNLRQMILAGEHYRQVFANAIGLGTTESQALSYLAVHGESGQSALARDLGLTSSASTALVDRLERQGVAERVRHPRDRRRTIVHLTDRGLQMVAESHRWLATALEEFPPEQLDDVSNTLVTIADNLWARTSNDRVAEWGDVTRALPA